MLPRNKVLDASLPVPDAKEDNLEHDAPPQEPQQPGAATAPQELDGQQSEVASPLPEPPGEQAEAAGTNVGQTEHSSVTLKEEAETMETSPSAASTKDGVDAEKDDDEDANTVKQLPSLEEDAENLDQASEPQSYDLGFKKVFKFVGFRFTVKKEKTGKSEPVQLLTVKKETQVVEGAGDEKEVSSEETAMPEDAHCAEDNTKDTLKNEQTEHESPKTPEANEICSESAALATDTASPLRRFFTQGWSAFRKKKSFRKSKEDELQSPTQEEEQEKEGSTLTTETSEKKEKSEFEKQDEEKNMTAVTTEVHEKEQTDGEKQESEKTVAAVGAEACEKEELMRHNETGQKEDVAPVIVKESVMEKKAEEGGQEGNLVEVSEDLGQKEEKTEEGGKESEVTEKPLKTKSVVPVITDSVNRELKTSSEVLPVGEKLESTGVKCETEDRNEIASEEKLEAGSLAIEITSEQLKKSEGGEGNKPSPLGKETWDEKTEKAELKISATSEDITGKLDTQGEAQDRTTEKKASKEHGTKLTLGAPGLKSFSTSECSVDTEDDQRTIKPTDEGLQGKPGIVLTDTVKPDEITTEITPEEAAGKRPPEGIINEAELLSSQEKTRPQGSPLKKLFTGTGLKKLSGKKQKGKREESKLGEQGESIQHLSDSPDSPEEQKGESSASSPEETNEIPSLEKSADGMQVTENEEAATSDVERKRESVTAWASFKKMVTPKKRVRRPSESDKEEEIDKTKDAAVSATENAVDEKQGEFKENGMDQKPEKTTEEPKRKVDTSVSWEAFICVGSSKKRARRKSSSSDEETEHKLAQENQKVEEPGQTKETVTDAILTSSQESDQGQGNSSPEQAGSPSEGEGISTWESFKRLVTPRRKSKTRMEERTEDSVVGSSLEHSTSDGEPGKDESWVPFRKLMPRRRKKKSDGKPESNNLKQTREDMAETAEEDSDIPAVVPLSEYEAAEQEKMEAQQTKDAEAMRERTSEEERAEKLEESLRIEQGHEGLVHVVTVTVVEGERAVSSIEERSPSWISAALTECIEQAKEEEEKETETTFESDVLVEEAVVAAKTEPDTRKDRSDDTTASELELTSEAVTALEETAEASCAEGTMEVSLAEETTEMVSAVSQLLETPDTTEEVTPVQEVEATEQNLKELDKQTQKVLQEVAERVKSADAAQLVSERTMTTTVITTVEEIESEVEDDAKDGQVVGQATVLLDQSLKMEEHKDDLQALGSAGSIQDQTGLEGSVLPEGSERTELSAATKESTEGCENVDVSRDESQCQACEEPVVEDHEEVSEAQRTVEEPSSEDRDPHIVKAVTPEEEPFPKKEASEQEKLPVTDFAVDEKRDECIPEVHTAVQDKMEDETSSLGLPPEEPVQLEGQDKTLTMGPECTEAAVTVVPMKPERQDEIPELDSQEQTCTKGVPGKTPAQIEEKEDDNVLLGEESTEIAVTEVPLQNEVKTSALPSETIGSEAAADAEQNVRYGDGRQITEKDPVPFLEPQCREKTTEILSQSHETESGKMEDAVPKTEIHLERGTPITEAPMQIEADNVSNVASTCPDLPENGSTILTDTIPKKCETLSSLAEEETVEKEEKFLETSTFQDFQKEDNKNERLMERAEEVFESRIGEAVRAAECSSAVQQEVLTVQEEGSDSAFPQAKSLEALTVPVAAAAAEEHIMAETVTPTDTTSETVQPLATTAEQMASEGVPVAAVDFSGCGTAELGSAETPEPQVSPTSINGMLEEQERPQSTEQPKQNGIPLIHSLSLTHMEFETDIVQSVSIESQSTKIVSNAIETAVHKLAETEEPAAFEPEQCSKSTGKSPSDTPELLESTQVDHQLPEGKEDIWNNGQELQQSQIVKTATIAESAEIHAPVEKTKDMLLTSEVLEDGPNQNSLTIMTSPEDISRESEGLQISTPELSTSENLTKDPIDIHPPKLREKEVGWIMEITDKHTGQHMCRESEEERHPLPVEDGKKQKWEDDNCQEATSCDSPQSQNSVAPEALNMC
ncbi:A-kinase anchor protein 12 isoform A [Patagioenas fasciata monilis]|uniref:A-kinase anchor protein 12 isoform A n=1 Tax=Patagioenas fasciata monilis TaxID=372326 RepID=A0A1V4JLI2_PATFA|nr:A-kinase anchor protein 12 isoform A [Patagioenas fasciata monilis]